jgi:hypothetical protein
MRTWLVSIVSAFVLTTAAAAQTTALTYQGRLKNGGEPASGLHDFRFRLFDAPAGGTQLGGTQCVNNVTVADGLFTASIDFGQQFASPDRRFLEIQVREDTGLGCGNGAGFVTLNPRQPLTAAPLASHANSAFALDAADGGPANAVFVDAEGKVGIGTASPETPLHLNGVFQWGGTSTNIAFSGEDAFGLYIEQFGSSPARSPIRIQTSKSGDANNYSQFFIDPSAGFSFMTLGTGNGNVGIGTQSPAAKLDVRGDIRLGASGQFQAAAGTENLRLIRGDVDGNGTILLGSGFAVNRVADGIYDITFASFAGVPTVTVTVTHVPHSVRYGYSRLEERTPSFVRIKCVENDGAGINSDFSFCVIGPR